MASSKKGTKRSSLDMLIQAIVPPRQIALLPGDSFGQKLFCNLWLGLFCEFVENCVLVLPKGCSTDADYFAALSGWPPKYQKRAFELITMLRLQHRFVQADTETPLPLVSESCGANWCAPFLCAFKKDSGRFLLTDADCIECADVKPLASRAFETIEYFCSDFARQRRARIAYVLGDAQWTKADFARNVLAPVFKTAKHVKIFDRWIGRSILDRRYGRVRFGANYKRTLEWVVEAFRDAGGACRGGIFEIYCGIEGASLSASQRVQIRSEIATLEMTLSAVARISVRFILKEESDYAKCPHGRYLVTDQIALLIDRGFDLLWDDEKMRAARLNPAHDPRPIRDVAVILCGDCSSVESQTIRLPAF